MDQLTAQVEAIQAQITPLLAQSTQFLEENGVFKYWAQFEQWSAQTEKQIIEWALEGDAYANHPREAVTSSWPLGSFQSALIVVALYLAYVLVASLWQISPLGRTVELYGLRFVYNFAQVVLCSYMCVESVMLAYRNGYSWTPCNAFNTENPPIANLLWLFYVSKVLDFLDTVFIISKKSWKQLSFLHVYHHCTIFSFYWLNLRVGYDGDIFLTITLNGLIHAIMYSYYLVSMHTKDVWWKKYLTVLQMFQFVLMCSQASYMLKTNCGTYPRNVTMWYLVYIITLLVLFLQYFVQTHYSRQDDKGTKPSKSTKNGKVKHS